MASFSTEADVATQPLRLLCEISKAACDEVAPMVREFYWSITGATAKLKADKSVFTIADGIVQHLLTDYLFTGDRFANVVGEEDDSHVNITKAPYMVEELVVPEEYYALIDNVKAAIEALSTQIDANAYKSLTVFIDPIDGTREFSTELGEQCSICIGFSDSAGRPVAGIVYRPIPDPATYAAGAKSEGFTFDNLDLPATPVTNGLLTSNGKISTYIESLIAKLGYVRVPSGGAGNKMMMLLEGKGSAYIQDRGVSRWDTCGAQAVIEAHGGVLLKMTDFMRAKGATTSYTYLKSTTNLDFESNVSFLTPYNVVDKAAIKKGDPPTLAADVSIVKPYSNLCGLVALASGEETVLSSVYDAMTAAAEENAPAYD